MNRMILHLVFQDPAVRPRNHDNTQDAEIVKAARAVTVPIFTKVAEYLERIHPGEYPAPLSKNLSKCETLARNYNNPPSPGTSAQGSLLLSTPGQATNHVQE
jgi:hypothetical protein